MKTRLFDRWGRVTVHTRRWHAGALAVVLAVVGPALWGLGQAWGAPAGSLKGVCPDRLIVQTDWFPEPEHGYTYQLIGPGGKIDKKKGTYSGPIGNTGVELEIRAGGPFIGFQPPVAQMYSDERITLAYADTADQIRNSKKLPTVGIYAPLLKGPQILMYNPTEYDFKTIADVGKSGVKVLFFEGSAYMDFLLAKGLLKKEQIDGSYDGAPARWVSTGGKVVQQGFATNEPYKYENDIEGWKKPVKFLLVHDAGYVIYQSSIVVRPQTLARHRPCLRRLVPMMQQSMVDYFANPAPVNNGLLKIVKEFASFWTLSPGGNEYAVRTMRELGIVGNGPDGVLGTFETARVQRLITDMLPIFKQKRLDSFKPDLKPGDIVTNEFINRSIKFK